MTTRAGSARADPAPPPPPPARRILTSTPALLAALSVVLLMALGSLFIGVSDVSPATLFADDDRAALLLVASRIPRTLALILTGASLSIVGLIMQMLVRNRFVEPSTAGTTESAALGLLVATLAVPAAPLMAKMGIAAVFALVGTVLFLLLLRRVPVRSLVLVPLIGITLGGVIGAVTTFIAYREDLLQTLGSWLTGDFSGVLRGRYELLWIAAVMTALAWLAADRFTVAGMGREFSTNLGLHYGRVLALGLAVVAVVSAVVVVTAGAIPFLGLIVPNVVSILAGDNLRRSIPWVAVLGAGFLLICDMVGRVVRMPYEVPVGVIVGVVGAVAFLYLLLREPGRAH